MEDCNQTNDCKPQPELDLGDTGSEPEKPVERVRRVVMAEDPCCPLPEDEDEEDLGVTVEICGQVRIVNGRIVSWPESFAPILSLISSDGSIEINQRGCTADIMLADTNANFNCGDGGIVVQNGRIISLSKAITSIEFDDETCLEARGFNPETCALVIGLREGCSPLGSGGDTGGGGTGQWGGNIVWSNNQGLYCDGGSEGSVTFTVEEVTLSDDRVVYRIGYSAVGTPPGIQAYFDPPGLIGSQYSNEIDATIAAEPLHVGGGWCVNPNDGEGQG